MCSTLRTSECIGISLKWLATITTGIYAGGNIYISFIETPARNELRPKHNAQILQMTHLRAKQSWTPIALFGATSAFAGFLLTRGNSGGEWLLADAILLGALPMSVYFVWPTGTAIMDSKDTDDVATEKGENWLVGKLQLWSKYHNLRTMVGLMAFGYMASLLARRK